MFTISALVIIRLFFFGMKNTGFQFLMSDSGHPESGKKADALSTKRKPTNKGCRLIPIFSREDKDGNIAIYGKAP